MSHIPSVRKRRRRRRNVEWCRRGGSLWNRMILEAFANGELYLSARELERKLHPTGFEHMSGEELIAEMNSLVNQIVEANDSRGPPDSIVWMEMP